MRIGRVALWRDQVSQVSIDVRHTETAAERMRGLLGSEPLMQASGLWIGPCNSVHCWFMRYAIDVVYLDRRGFIIKCVSDLKPWGVSASLRAASVVELLAGEVARLDIRVGDEVRWCD